MEIEKGYIKHTGWKILLKESWMEYWGNKGEMMKFCSLCFTFLSETLKAQDLLTVEAEIKCAMFFMK